MGVKQVDYTKCGEIITVFKDSIGLQGDLNEHKSLCSCLGWGEGFGVMRMLIILVMRKENL